MEKTNDIVIYGAGGFGRETALLIHQINAVKKQWNVLGFLDDIHPQGKVIDGLAVLGGPQFLKEKPSAVVIAIADPNIRRAKYNDLKSLSLVYPALIHPTANLGDVKRNWLGEGVIITAMTVMTTNVIINSFAIINLACTIGHDVTIGSFSSIMPMSAISGFVTLGDGVLIGTGARILPSLNVGNNAVVGAGAVVTKNVEAGKTVMGIPAR